MSYKTATEADLQVIAERMLKEPFADFRREIQKIQLEVIALRREVHELRQAGAANAEQIRVLSCRLKSSTDRLVRAVNSG